MLESAPKPVWYMVGGAVVILALAVGYRIVNPNQDVKISGGKDGFSVQMGAVQDSIDQAEQTVATVTQQAEEQRAQIVQLEERVKSQQQRIEELLAQIQKMPQAPAALRSSVEALHAAEVAAPVASIRPVDPQLLAAARLHLSQAKTLAAKLAQQQR